MKVGDAKAQHVIELIRDVFNAHNYEEPDELHVIALKEPNADVVQAGVSPDGTITMSTATLELPDDLIRAVLEHEVGHIALGHIYLPQEVYQGDRARFEIAADAFAAKQVGAGTMLALARKVLRGPSKDARIAALEALAHKEAA